MITLFLLLVQMFSYKVALHNIKLYSLNVDNIFKMNIKHKIKDQSSTRWSRAQNNQRDKA